MLADLACAIADGTEVISDFRVIGDQQELFGLVASVSTAWRMLDEIARGGERALGRVTAAVNAARRRATAKGWLGQLAYLDAAHRVHARVEDAIRTGKDCGIGKHPSTSLAMNRAWQAAALTAAALLAWLRLLALDFTFARAEPKTLRYRILHAARLTRSGRQHRVKIDASWPWAPDIVTAWDCISALPQAP